MNGGSELDIEKGDDIPTSVVPLLGVDDGPTFRRQRGTVVNAEPPEAPDAPPRPVDYTFRGRHVEMIAIGLSMGTGVLYDSGNYLWWGGPGSLVLSYLLMWTVLFAVMMSLREMIAPLPIPGAVFSLANRVLCPAIGFAAGWMYFLSYAIDFPNKVTTAAAFVTYWDKDAQLKGLWLTIFFLIPIGFNFLYVRRLGEIEYWFTTAKIILILIVIVTGILIAMGLSTNPLLGTSSQYQPVPCSANEIGPCLPGPGLINWRNGLAFKTGTFAGGALGGLAGFWKCCTLAVFSYVGCETVGITADEVERQRETLPRAVNRVTSRIAYIYIGALLVLGVTLSANDPLLTQGIENTRTFQGGYIVMVLRANIPVLPDIINAVMILAVIGNANADLYVASRCLYALAREHHAPSVLAQHTWAGVPYLALLLSASFGLLAYVDLRASAYNIFQLFSSITSVAVLLAWAVICATYLRFRRGIKAQRLERTLEERANSPLQPYLASYGLVACVFCALFAGFEAFLGPNNIVWSQWALRYGYTFAPFGVIAGFVGLVVLSRFVIGSSAFEVPLEDKMDLKTQRARKLAPLPSSKFTLRTAIDKALNF